MKRQTRRHFLQTSCAALFAACDVAAQQKRVRTFAGTGTPGYDAGIVDASKTPITNPYGVVVGPDGGLYFCEYDTDRIRSVDRQTGLISTFAGTGERGLTPDQGPIDGTPLNGPRSMDIAPNGNVYLVLREGNAVFRIEPAARRITRLGGTGAWGYSGDRGGALLATFNGPKGIAWVPDGSLLVVDTENHAIRRIDLTTNTVDTVIGTGQRGDGPDGDPRLCAMARPHGVSVFSRKGPRFFKTIPP